MILILIYENNLNSCSQKFATGATTLSRSTIEIANLRLPKNCWATKGNPPLATERDNRWLKAFLDENCECEMRRGSTTWESDDAGKWLSRVRAPGGQKVHNWRLEGGGEVRGYMIRHDTWYKYHLASCYWTLKIFRPSIYQIKSQKKWKSCLFFSKELLHPKPLLVRLFYRYT